MNQVYNNKMNELGYNQLVCDIFLNWEDVKDEILLPERKQGSGNGTIHVFLGAADAALREEFPSYYEAVDNGEDTSVGAIEVKHYFTPSNIISMLGYVCKYLHDKGQEVDSTVSSILEYLAISQDESGLLYTRSLLKLSVGSNKLRPYFKQFESNGVFTKLVRQILLPNSSYKISLYKNEDGEYAAFWLIGFNWINDFEADSSGGHIENPHAAKKDKDLSLYLQQIYYGAPGTGKSHATNEVTSNYPDTVRTTFHPDSDYSTFVGAYKPTMTKVRKAVVIGQDEKEVKPLDGNSEWEEKIAYKFVKQAFLKAYVKAWKKFAETCVEGGELAPQFLVIEEINRGNCAQIFGDLFQLLDRKNNFSEYPIEADADICKALLEEDTEDNPSFGAEGLQLTEDQKIYINSVYDGKPVAEKICSGQVLVLPPNLYIWATMNTSDQSLFPIDSAFKRRWDWKYMPIDTEAKTGWKIKIGDKNYSWSSFLGKINDEIQSATSSEDKQLGFFFCKADENGEISAEKFVSKVLFYIYNDVFKDYGLDREFFKDKDTTDKKITFQSMFEKNGDVKDNRVAKLLDNLGVEVVEISFIENYDEESDSPNAGKSEHKETLVAVTIDDERLTADGKTQFDLYLNAIKKLGVAKIAPVIESMKYRRKESPMAVRDKLQSITGSDGYSYVEAEGYYFVKGAHGYTLIRILEDLNNELNLNIKIEYK